LKFTRTFFAFCFTLLLVSGCGVYKFNEATVNAELKTARVQFIENRAPYVNPQLSPTLTEKLRRKVNNQTKLKLSNDDNVHLDIRAEIRDYSVTTSGVSNQTTSQNRLNVSVHVILTNNLENKTEEFDISRPFDFSATLSLQAAENEMLDRITRELSDDIFNRLFSKW
jgi:hypothetical protein